MAKAKNKVIAGSYERKKVVLRSTLSGRKAVIRSGYIRVVPLDKKRVESYEVIDESSRKSAASAVGRAAVGSFFLGLPGLAAGLSAKSKGTHIVAIQFRNGKRSLLEVDDKIYRAIMTKVF